jgi:hypothetical protein
LCFLKVKRRHRLSRSALADSSVSLNKNPDLIFRNNSTSKARQEQTLEPGQKRDLGPGGYSA